MFDFPLPQKLHRLMAMGIWPSVAGPSLFEQEVRPIVSTERVRLLAAEETLICLETPPFATVAHHQNAGGAGDFWERFGAIGQIDPEQALIIGDFGLGTDTAIILDYSRNRTNPPVLRLRWDLQGRGNEWVLCASDFDEFIEMLGLDPRVQ